jgi:membrane protease YdiL (CAAX protease family)
MMFNQLSSLAKATIFYGLALGLILLLALLGQGLGEMILVFAMFTPLAAVLFMQFVVTRDGSTRAGWRILGFHQLGFRSWGFAILAPFLVMLCTYGIVWSSGIGRLDQTVLNGVIMLDSPVGVLQITFNILRGLMLSMFLALGEEIGWRGYLLPQLLPLGRTRALLLSGLLQGIWHLPLILLTPFYHTGGDRLTVVILFLLTLTVAGIFYGYLRLTSQSVWPAALAHGAFNMFLSTFAAMTVAVGSVDVLEYWAGESGVITLVATTLAAAWLLYRLQRQPGTGQTVISAVEDPA